MFIQVRIDLSFVPDVISRCQHIDSPVKQFVCDFRGNTEPRRRILAIEDGEIDPVFLLEMFEVLADDAAACASDRVADKEDFQKGVGLSKETGKFGVPPVISYFLVLQKIGNYRWDPEFPRPDLCPAWPCGYNLFEPV